MIGPIFQREYATLPRRPRHFVARLAFLAMVFAIICTAWLLLAGIQPVQNAGDLARFGVLIFQLIAPFQLIVLLFAAALAGVSAVSFEKDRQTLTLLLMTSLSNTEVVLGKIGAGLLSTINAFIATAPVVFLLPLLGGVSLQQAVGCLLLTGSTLLLCCVLGATIAFWREKTFQAIAVTTLLIALWIAFGEAVAFGAIPGIPVVFAPLISPLRAVWDVVQPIETTRWFGGMGVLGNAILPSAIFTAVAFLLALFSVRMLRVWNPSRERRPVASEYESSETASDSAVGVGSVVAGGVDGQSAGTATGEGGSGEKVKVWKSREPRAMWNNPILWREVKTWAYGRKILMIRIAYLLLAMFIGLGLFRSLPAGSGTGSELREGLVSNSVALFAPLMVFSLILINALAVNSITNERDAGALDLLLVTEITPWSFVFGKIAGVLYATKEMVIVPILLSAIYWWVGGLSTENLIFVILSLMVMDIFVAMLGIHCGMIYSQSRTAIGTSLGTVFFLFLGVATCMLIMLMFRGSFGRQLAPFLFIILGGGTGLYMALGNLNPSPAITLTSFLLPFLTFFAITSFILRNQELTVFSTVTLSYGFATAAMLIPAISEFQFAQSQWRPQQEE
jgi:ABC-type transport system involved in multi-copper enzyme maturation permease subunit